MQLTITLVSILAVTGFLRVIKRWIPHRVCPICAGVSGTWGWMLFAYAAGYPIDLMIVAILMGGSVVGIAYQLERRLPRLPAVASEETGAVSRGLLWKTLFIPAGFAGVYGILTGSWPIAAVALTAAACIVFVFSRKKENVSASLGKQAVIAERVAELEEKMKQCC